VNAKFGLGSLWMEVPLSGRGGQILRAKIRGSKSAESSKFWSDRVTTVQGFRGLTITKSPLLDRLDLSDRGHSALLKQWRNLAISEMRSYQKVPLVELLPDAPLALFDAPLVAATKTYLRWDTAFHTGQHGDLHSGNMLVADSSRILLTDLDCFSAKGTFEFDLFHFSVSSISKSTRTSWLDLVTNEESLATLGRHAEASGHRFSPTFIAYYVFVRSYLEGIVQGRVDRFESYRATLEIVLSTRNGDTA